LPGTVWAGPTWAECKAAVTIERLRSTLALYRGDFAEALPDERCLEPERRNLRDKWVQGASRLLSLLAAARA